MNIIDKHVSFGNSGKPLNPRGIVTHAIYNRSQTGPERFDPNLILDILRHYNVVAHYLLCRNGDIWELCHPNIQAWHAGKSEFRGLTGLNKYFIGVEWIGDEAHDFTDAQYESGAQLYSMLMIDHDIPSYNITMHRITSGPDVRDDWKWDPGERFDWIRFGMMLRDVQ